METPYYVSARTKAWIFEVGHLFSDNLLELRGGRWIGHRRGPVISGWPDSVRPTMRAKWFALENRTEFHPYLESLFAQAGTPPPSIAARYAACWDSLDGLLVRIRGWALQKAEEIRDQAMTDAGPMGFDEQDQAEEEYQDRVKGIEEACEAARANAPAVTPDPSYPADNR